MNNMEKGLLKYLKDYELEEIQKIKIGIAGCGGLGSNVAHNLVRLGYKNFVLIDFDKIEVSNLNRQFYFLDQVGQFKTTALKQNLLRINPDLKILDKNVKIDRANIEEIFYGCDIVVEGFDNIKDKILLIETLSSHQKCISVSGLGNYWDVEDILTKKINKNLVIVGDFKSDIEINSVPLSPGVSICAAKQASSVLKFTLEGLIYENH